MRESMKKLIDVKSIMTLMLTVLFCIVVFKGTIPQEFLIVYTMIVSFYFGTQKEKKSNS